METDRRAESVRYLYAVMGKTKHISEPLPPSLPRDRRWRGLCGAWGDPEAWWRRDTAYMTEAQLAKVLARPLCKSCAKCARIDGDE